MVACMLACTHAGQDIAFLKESPQIFLSPQDRPSLIRGRIKLLQSNLPGPTQH